MVGVVMGKPILCLDFDGVINSYTSGWMGAEVIPDPPVPGVIDFIVKAHESFNIAIVSSRFRHPGGREAVREWLVRQGIEPLYLADDEEIDFDRWEDGAIVLSRVRPPAFLTIDDRALTFRGTWPDPADLLSFRPWHKEPKHAVR